MDLPVTGLVLGLALTLLVGCDVEHPAFYRSLEVSVGSL